MHARLLVSESHFFIKEAYLSLLEAVCTIYVERRRRAGATHRGLNVGLTETKRALQILAMVNKYQVRCIPVRFVRYGTCLATSDCIFVMFLNVGMPPLIMLITDGIRSPFARNSSRVCIFRAIILSVFQRIIIQL